MTQVKLRESVTEAPVKAGNRWRVIVARPGKGSSGTYSEELFRRDAAKIIAPGAQSFINHDDSRNPKDMIGYFPEAAYFDEAEKAVVAELEVFSHWEAFVNEVGPHCGISLYALGEADADGNVTQIIEDRMNGADLVARPGLVGSGLAEKLYESAVAAGSVKEPTVTVAEDERNKLMEKEILDAINSVKDSLAALVADKVQKEAETAQVEADEKAIQTAVEHYDAAVKMVTDADLFESQRESILAAAKKGEDVTGLVEAAKRVREEAVKAVTEQAAQSGADGVVLGESGKSFTVSGWGA